MSPDLGQPTPGAGATVTAPPRRIGDLLLQARLISPRQLEEALAAQTVRRKRLGEILIEDRILDDVAVAAVLSVPLHAPPGGLPERPREQAAPPMIPGRDAPRPSLGPLV